VFEKDFTARRSSQRLNSLLKNSPEVASGAKALTERKGLIAALKALRHPQASFSARFNMLLHKKLTPGEVALLPAWPLLVVWSASASHANLSHRKDAVSVNGPSWTASPVSAQEPEGQAWPAAAERAAPGATG
jgi:hypothetical protein